MTDCPVAGDRHQRRWFNAPHSSTSSPSFLMTESIVNVTHHRFVSDLHVKKTSSSSVSSSHSGPEVKHPLSSARDPVSSKLASASDRRGPRPGTSETAADRHQALDLWQTAGSSPSKGGDNGHKTPPSEVTSDAEKQTSPSVNGERMVTGSGRQKQTKEAGDAAAGGAEGGGGSGGQETSYSSCFEGSGSSSSQATWFSVTDCSLSAIDQEKKRVSFGDCNVPCPDPDKKNSLHKRSILKATAAATLADSSAAEAAAGDEGGGEGIDVEKTGGARHEGCSERDLEVDKIVNSAALTKKRLRKRSTNNPSQNRESQVLLILSGRFSSTPRRNQSVGAPAKEADKVRGRRRSEQPAAAASGCGPGHPTDVHLSGSRRGHRPQTPPPQRRRRCQSSGGIVNQSYKEDEGDGEEGEEGDNRRNAERLQEGEGGEREGQEGGWKEELKVKRQQLVQSSSTCYLVHLRDMDRIPKHVDHIMRKFNLHLLEPQNITCHNNSIDVEIASPPMTGRVTMKQQQQQSVAASIPLKKKESDEKLQNSLSSSSCLEQEISKTRSLSLRRRLSLRFSKKTGSLDKSKSVPGPSNMGQGGGGGGGSSREETATGLGGGSIKSPTSSGVEESKDTTESCGAAGNSEDLMKKNSEAGVMSDATYRAQKKAPRWRKLSLHIFRKSRDRVTEEAEQHPQLQQEEEEESKEREESSDALARDKTDGAWKGHQSPPPLPPPLSATGQTAEGTTVGALVSNAKRTSSETTSKVLISDPQQQKTRSPATSYQDPATEVETLMVRPAETRTQGKTESNRELTLQQRPTSQSPWKTTKTVTQTSSSDVIIVPLVAKTSQVFQDAVFYFPSQEKDDDDDDGARDGMKGGRTAAGVAKSEGKVPQPSKSSSLRLPLKGAISETRDEVELRQRRRSPRRLERRRSSFLLRRIRAFFGRSSGSAEDQETEEEGRMRKDEEQLVMRQDVEMEVPQEGRTSSSLLLKHPTAPAPSPHQLKDSIPLLHAESFDPPPHPPPPPPHKHSSSSTLTYARRQSSSENQLPLSANRRSVSPFVGEGQERSGKGEEKRGRQREDESVER